MDNLECNPAYGADYTSQRAVKDAWARGQDFQIVTAGPDYSRYMNNGDADLTGVGTVLIRYANLQKVVQVR